MVIASGSLDPSARVVPKPSLGSGGRLDQPPVLEIKQKTSSRNEKRTHRDYYRHSGNDKQPPIEYVYTYSEETPNQDMEKANQTGDLVPANGSAALGKIECTVGEDGNLVVKIRGKPDNVPLDPQNLPVTLPEGWQLKEIQTTQRSRKTERSRKLKIKDERAVEEEGGSAVVVYNEHTVAVNGSAHQDDDSDMHYGNAEEDEYDQGERNGTAYVHKKSKKYLQGAVGSVSRIEEMRTEEGTNIDHPNNKQRVSRNLRSVLERTESAKQKFSKQSVTDEKVTETHKSNIMYFDGDSSSGPVFGENLRDDTSHSNYYGRSDLRRRSENQQDGSVIIESPDDTPYNSLDRKTRRQRSEDVEIINVDDNYRYHHPEDQSHIQRNQGPGNSNAINRSGKTTTFENRRGYYSEAAPGRYEEDYDTVEDHSSDSVKTDHRNFKCSYPPNPDYDSTLGSSCVDAEAGERKQFTVRDGQVELKRDRKGNLVENIEKTDTEEYYQIHPERQPHAQNGDTLQRNDRLDETRDEQVISREREDLFRIPGSRPLHQISPDDRSNRILERVVDTTTEDNYRYHSGVNGFSFTNYPDRISKTSNATHLKSEINHFPDTPLGPQPRNDNVTKDTNVTNIHEIYRYHPAQHPHIPDQTDSFTRTEKTNVREYANSPVIPGRDHTTEEKSEKAKVNNYFGVRVLPTSTPQQHERTDEKIVTTSLEEYRRLNPRHSPTLAEQPAKKSEEHQETVDITKRYQGTALTPTKPKPVDTFEENIEKTTIQEVFRVHPRPLATQTQNFRDNQTQVRETYQSSGFPTERTTVEKTDDQTKVFGSPYRSASVPRTEEVEEVTETTTVKDYYDVLPRPSINGESVNHLRNDTVEKRVTEHLQRDAIRHLDSTRMVGTEARLGTTMEKSPSPPHDRSVKEDRTIPVAGVPADSPSRSSRSSSIDLSEIKPAEHVLDNRILKDRGNLAQGGSMGMRRPPTRNPVKYHFGDENGPDDVMSSSDVTLTSHIGASTFQPAASVRNGNSVASYDTAFYGNENRYNKNQATAVKKQQVTRDEQVLVNYVDTSRKPDWVQNIDQHFAGRNQGTLHYGKTSVSRREESPRIEEIVSVPGSTVIKVNGEFETVHGIVSEPDYHIPITVAKDDNLIHESEKGSLYAFTRATASNGHLQSAKEKVSYEEKRESQRQIAVSYDVPGVGKETREYTWDGINQQPQEKITFEESRDHSKDVTVKFGLDAQRQEAEAYHTTTETKETEEKFVFDETRETPHKEISVKLAIEGQQEVAAVRQPTTADMFHFNEEIDREREVSVIVNLDQEDQPQPVNRQNIHATHQGEFQEIRHKEVHDTYFYEPPPEEKVTFHEDREIQREVTMTLGLVPTEYQQPPVAQKLAFHEDREIQREVSMTLGIESTEYPQPPPEEKITFHEDREIQREVSLNLAIEPLEPIEPVTIDKFSFEETRLVDHPVSFKFGLNEPIPKPPSPQPISTISDSTIITQEIVPHYTRSREDIIKTDRIERKILEPVPEYSHTYEEDTRVEEFRQTIFPAPTYKERTQERTIEKTMEIRASPPKVTAVAEIVPPQEYRIHEETRRVDIHDIRATPPRITATTEIVPPQEYRVEEEVRRMSTHEVRSTPPRLSSAAEIIPPQEYRVEEETRRMSKQEVRSTPPRLSSAAEVILPQQYRVEEETRRMSTHDVRSTPPRLSSATEINPPQEYRVEEETRRMSKHEVRSTPPRLSSAAEIIPPQEYRVEEETRRTSTHEVRSSPPRLTSTAEVVPPQESHFKEETRQTNTYESRSTPPRITATTQVLPPQEYRTQEETRQMSSYGIRSTPPKITPAVQVFPPPLVKETTVREQTLLADLWHEKPQPVLHEAREENTRIDTYQKVMDVRQSPPRAVVAEVVPAQPYESHEEKRRIDKFGRIVEVRASPPRPPPLHYERIEKEEVTQKATEVRFSPPRVVADTMIIPPPREEAREEVRREDVLERVVDFRESPPRVKASTEIIPPRKEEMRDEVYKEDVLDRYFEKKQSPPRVVVETRILPPVRHETREEVLREEVVEKFMDVRTSPPRVTAGTMVTAPKWNEVIEGRVVGKSVELRQAPAKITASVDVTTPPAKLTTSAEVIPPLPRKVSISAEAQASEVHHTEVDLVPKPKRIYETSVDYKPHDKRERTEQNLKLDRPGPAPLPPTSGRIEKHVNLEKIVPEPTGQPLPHPLGTYGYVYQATLESKKPEPEKGIDFHIVETPAVTERERVEQLQWYIKEGVPHPEIPDDESIVGEPRSVSPPYHPELTASAEIETPTHVRASVKVSPPRERPKKEPPPVPVKAKVTDIPKYHFGEVVQPPVLPPKLQVSQMLKTIIAEAAPTHHTEVNLTREEEERWKSSLVRHPLPKSKRTETALQLQRPPVLPKSLPPVSGRVLKKTERETVQPESTGKPLPKALGTYGFLYIATVEPRLESPNLPTIIREAEMDSLYLQEAEINYVDLDIQQVIVTALAEVHPPLTVYQQEQMLTATAEIFPPLTEQQQQKLLTALIEIVPPLTAGQQYQLLTGSGETTPPLTIVQQQQLLFAHAEIIPPLTVFQEERILRASVSIVPPLAVEQQRQFLTAIAEIFPPPQRTQRDLSMEKVIERTPRPPKVAKPSGRIPRKTWSGKLELAPTGQILPKELGLYGFLYTTRVEPKPVVSEHTRSIEFQEVNIKFVDLDYQQVLLTAFAEIEPSLTMEQEEQLLYASAEIFPRLTEAQQARLLEVLVDIKPPLTSQQHHNLLTGKEDMSPPLTPGQQKQLLVASAEIITMTVQQERKLLYASAHVTPPLTAHQQQQLVTAVADFFPSPQRVEEILQLEHPQLPHPTGRIPAQHAIETLRPSVQLLPVKSMGVYGFVYMTHVDAKSEAEFNRHTMDIGTVDSRLLELDINQAVRTAVAEVLPPLTAHQEQQLLVATADIFPPLTEVQQQRLIDVLVEVQPKLTPNQQRDILTGDEEVLYTLDWDQYEQLLTASAEIVSVTMEQEKMFHQAFTSVKPPLSDDQQRQLFTTMAEFFPTPERVEQFLELAHADSLVPEVPKPSGRKPKHVTEETSRPSVELRTPHSPGTYGFVYLTHVDAKAKAALTGQPINMRSMDATYIELDVVQIIHSAISEVVPPLTTLQEERLVDEIEKILQPLTDVQQESLLRAVDEIIPPLTPQQQVQILNGNEEVTPPITLEQAQQLLVRSAKIVTVSVKQERDLLCATARVQPELSADQKHQVMTAVMNYFPAPEKVERMIRLEQLRNLPEPSRRYPKHVSTTGITPSPVQRPQPLALGIYGYLYSAEVGSHVSTRPLLSQTLGITSVELDVRKAVQAVISEIQPSLSTEQISDLSEATVQLIPKLTVPQQRQVVDFLSRVTPELSVEQQRQLVTGRQVLPSLTLEQAEQLLVYSSDVLSVSSDLEMELQHIVKNVTPLMSTEQLEQFMNTMIVMFPSYEQATAILQHDSRLTPGTFPRIPKYSSRTEITPSPLGKRQQRTLGVYGFLYSTQVDSSSAARQSRSVETSSIKLDVQKAVLTVVSEIQPQLTTNQISALLNAAVLLIPELSETQKQRAVEVLSTISPELTTVQQHQLLTGSEVSPPLTADQTDQLLIHSSEVLFISKDLEEELEHVVSQVFPRLSEDQREQFVNAISLIFPSYDRVTAMLGVECVRTIEQRPKPHHASTNVFPLEVPKPQPLEIGVYGYLYSTRVDSTLNDRAVNPSLIYLDVRKAVTTAVSRVQPLLTKKQTTDLITATADLIPRLSEVQQRDTVDSLLRVSPEVTTAQQRQILTGSAVSPALTEDQKEQLLLYSSEVLSITKDMEIQLQHFAAKIAPAMTEAQQKQFTHAMTVIFPTLKRVTEMLKLNERITLESSRRPIKHTSKIGITPSMERQQPLATGIYGYLYATRVDQPASGKSVQSQIDISSVQLNVRKALLSVISEIEPHLTTEQTTDLLSATVKLIPKLEENQRRRVANVLSRLTPELTVLQQQQLLMGNEVSPPLTEDQREQLLVHSSEVLFVSKDLERELQHVANRISPALTANQQQQFTRAMTMIFPTLERVKEILKIHRAGLPSISPRVSTAEEFPLEGSKGQPAAIGIYGYLYVTHVDGRETVRAIEARNIQLDIRKAVSSVLSSIRPPLTVKQTSDILQATVEIVPELKETQKRQAVNALSRLSIELTADQQHQLMTGKTIFPPLKPEQEDELLIFSAEISHVTRKQEEQLEHISTNVFPPLTSDQALQFVRAITLLFPSMDRVRDVIQNNRSRSRATRYSSEAYAETTGRKQLDALGIYGYLYTTSVDSSHTRIPRTPTDAEPLDINMSTVQLDVKKAVLSVISDVVPPLTSKQFSELFTATVAVIPRFTEAQQRHVFNALTRITPTLSPLQQRQLSTGDEVSPALTAKQKEELLIYSSEILFVSIDQERELEYIVAHIIPALTKNQQRQYMRAITMLFPSLERVKELLQLPRHRSPSREGRRTPRPRSSDRLHRHATAQQSRALGVYGYIYMAHIDLLAISNGRPLKFNEIDFRTLELDTKKALHSVVREISPTLTSKQEEDLFTASLRVIPALDDDQQQKLLRTLFQLHPELSPLQLHQLLSGSQISPPLTSRQQEQLLRAGAEIVSLSARLESELVHICENLYPPLSAMQQQQFISGINRLLPGPAKVTQILQELSTSTVYQQKALGTFGFLYMAHLDEKDVRDFQELQINIREIEASSIELDIEQALLVAFAEVQPPLSPKQQHQLLIASAEIFPPLTEQQQRRVLHALVQLIPSLTVRQQRHLISGSDVIIPPLTTRQQEELYAASSEIITLTTKQEKQLLYASTQVSPPLSADQQRQLLKAVRDIFPGPRTGKTNTLIQTFQQKEESYRESRKTAREDVIGQINERGIWERTHSEERGKGRRVLRDASMFDYVDHPRQPLEYKGPEPEWVDDTRHLQVGEKTERFVGHGSYLKDKQIPLPDQRRWLAEQTTAIDDEEPDHEVSAISMNIKPRIKSEMYMASSPPLARTFSPAVGGFQYSASPPHGSPPLTEYSGFMYEAPVDGHGSPMSAEMGTYGFMYQTTLDGSEPYRKLAESNVGELQMYATSRRRSDLERSPESQDVKPMSATPPRRSPWSTPPVTPTPVMATPPSHSRGTTPMSSVKELPEPSKDSPWKKPSSSSSSGSASPENNKNVVTPWGRNWVDKDIVGGKDFAPIVRTFVKETPEKGQELHADIFAPEEETVERITETTTRIRQDKEMTFSDSAGIRSTSRPARPTNAPIQAPVEFRGIVEFPADDDDVYGQFDEAVQELQQDTKTSAQHSTQSTSTYVRNSGDVDKIHSAENTYLQKKTSSQGEVHRSMGVPQETFFERSETTNRKRQSDLSTEEHTDPSGFDPSNKKRTIPTTSQPIPRRVPEPANDGQPEWVRLVQSKQQHRLVPQQPLPPSDRGSKNAPRTRQLEELPEEDMLDATLDRILEEKRQSSSSVRSKTSPEKSPSQLRKWGSNQKLPSSGVETEQESSTSTFHRRTTERTEVIEGNRYHSQEAMLEAMETESDSDSNLKSSSSMSQSLPSLAYLKRNDGGASGHLARGSDSAISLDELQRTSRTLRRTDGAEEEVKDVSFARRGDAVLPETKRTKRTVVRKLVNGEWKEVAVREENMPVDSDLLMDIEQPPEQLLAELKKEEDDEWSLSDAVIEETTTTRTIRRVEEEEEDIISLAGTESSH